MQRIIFHVDMDSFFAACEIRQRPELGGKPVVVGADPRHGKGRGVVSTCNYAARSFGVHSGMAISQAYKLLPDAVYLPVNFNMYWQISDSIMAILRSHADKFQQTSIDEAFLEVTSRVKNYDDAKKLAMKIKEGILEKEKLTCSIGVGPNKLIAKMASDTNKPDGITVVLPEHVQDFLFPLPAGKLYGIGPKTEAVLKEMNIETVGDMANYDIQILQDQFGKIGTAMHSMANGIDESEIIEEAGIQSVGREVTFDEDTNDIILLNSVIDGMSEELYAALTGNGYSFRTITLKLRYENFETHTHQKTLASTTADLNALKDATKELLSYFLESKKKVRLIGIRLSNLKTSEGQKSLKSFE